MPTCQQQAAASSGNPRPASFRALHAAHSRVPLCELQPADLSAICTLIRSLSSARNRSVKAPKSAALPTTSASHSASACTRLSQFTCNALALVLQSQLRFW